MNSELIAHLHSLSHCLIHKEAKEWDKLFEYLDQSCQPKTGNHPVYYAPCCNTMLYYRGKNGYHSHKIEPIRLPKTTSNGKVNRAEIFVMLREAKMKKGDKYIYPAFNYPHLDFGLQKRYKDIAIEEIHDDEELLGKGMKKMKLESEYEITEHERKKKEELKRISEKLMEYLKKNSLKNEQEAWIVEDK